MTELRAYFKLWWLLVQVRCGHMPKRVVLSTPETDVWMQVAAANGWRALLVALQTARVYDTKEEAHRAA